MLGLLPWDVDPCLFLLGLGRVISGDRSTARGPPAGRCRHPLPAAVLHCQQHHPSTVHSMKKREFPSRVSEQIRPWDNFFVFWLGYTSRETYP